MEQFAQREREPQSSDAAKIQPEKTSKTYLCLWSFPCMRLNKVTFWDLFQPSLSMILFLRSLRGMDKVLLTSPLPVADWGLTKGCLSESLRAASTAVSMGTGCWDLSRWHIQMNKFIHQSKVNNQNDIW